MQHRQYGITNFSWWKLPGAAPRPLASLTVGIVAAVAGFLGSPFAGTGFGFISALLVGLLVRRWVRPAGVGLAQGLAGGILGGLNGALVAVAILGSGAGSSRLGSFIGGGLLVGFAVASLSRFTAGIAGAFVGEIVAALFANAAVFHEISATASFGTRFANGLGLGLAAGLAAGLLNRATPARGLRWSWYGLSGGLAIGLVTGLAIWAQVGAAGGLVVGLAALIAAGYAGGILFTAAATDLTKAASPSVVLIRDRATFWLSFLGFGLAVGITTGTALGFIPGTVGTPSNGPRIGLEAGLANFVATGITFAFIQASWGSFALAKWWLAISRRLPWRCMMFLNDAHVNRGVLRQVGAVYQFRHAELQRNLAGDK